MSPSSNSPSRFARALDKYGIAHCSVAGSTLCIGLGPDPEYQRTPLDEIPDAPTSICFLAAPLQAHLIEAFAASPEVRTVERLMVGTSHDYAVRRAGDYDMTDAIKALAAASFDKLTKLSLGDMELLFNGHRLLGRLGDITPLITAAPHMRELDVFGHFALAHPISHARLQACYIALDDVGFSGGALSQTSLSNLLSSNLPALTTLDLDLDESDRVDDYTIPDAFFDAAAFPALTNFAINCLSDEAATRLAAWKHARQMR